MEEALTQSTTRGDIALMVVNGDSLSAYVLKYDGGPRYLELQAAPNAPDVLKEILKPLGSLD
jgi:hypothetical protein